MPTSQSVNPPCEMCGVMTLIHSDHSGGWNECPSCGWMQDIRHTPGGQPGKLTGLAEGPTEEASE
jgi:hypothetical protein